MRKNLSKKYNQNEITLSKLNNHTIIGKGRVVCY